MATTCIGFQESPAACTRGGQFVRVHHYGGHNSVGPSLRKQICVHELAADVAVHQPTQRRHSATDARSGLLPLRAASVTRRAPTIRTLLARAACAVPACKRGSIVVNRRCGLRESGDVPCVTLGRRWQHARDFSRPALRCCYHNASFVNDRNVALVTEIRLKSYCFNAISEWSSYICRHRDTVRYHITFSGRLVCQTIHNYSSSTACLCTPSTRSATVVQLTKGARRYLHIGRGKPRRCAIPSTVPHQCCDTECTAA